jgi:hypothetical protein
MAAEFAVAAAIIGGMAYWNRSMGGPADPTPDSRFPEYPSTLDDPSSRPRSAARDTHSLAKFHRVGGEIKASPYNVANSPHSQSIYKIDPALEREAARITLAPSIDELMNR